MKTELQDFLKFKALREVYYNDMVDASVKNIRSQNTLTASRFALWNVISAFIAFTLLCSLKLTETVVEILTLQSETDIIPVGELITTNNVYHVSFALFTLIFLIFCTVFGACSAKDKIQQKKQSLKLDTIFDLLFLFFSSLFIVVVCLSTFIAKEPSNLLIIVFSVYSLFSLVVYSAYSIFIYLKLKKISVFDKNAEDIFQNKFKKYRELNEKIDKTRIKLMRDKKSILEIYKAIDSDDLDENDLKHLQTILDEIARINEAKNQKKIDAEKVKVKYKNDIKEYLGIEKSEKNLIVND